MIITTAKVTPPKTKSFTLRHFLVSRAGRTLPALQASSRAAVSVAQHCNLLNAQYTGWPYNKQPKSAEDILNLRKQVRWQNKETRRNQCARQSPWTTV